MRPNEYVFGTLMGNAARLKKYEYLTVLMKVGRVVPMLCRSYYCTLELHVCKSYNYTGSHS